MLLSVSTFSLVIKINISIKILCLFLLNYNGDYVFEQEKFFKNLEKGYVSLMESTYNLKMTSNKRQPVYINNVFSNTYPYVFEGDTISDMQEVPMFFS